MVFKKESFYKLYQRGLLHWKLLGVGALLFFLGGCFLYSTLYKSSNTQVQYQTSSAEYGTLVTTISASGSISSGNSTSITTSVSGEVQSVFVSNGDTVKKGDHIAQVMLNDEAQEQRSKAWVAYLDAQEAVKTAEKAKAAADIQMWQARQAILDAEEVIEDKSGSNINPQTGEEYTLSESTIVDKTLTKNQLTFSEAELQYKNADSEIQLAKAKVASAWEDYQELSPTIVAPASGVVSNLALAPGVTIETTSSNTSDTDSDGELTLSSQKIGQIDNTAGQFQATVNLTEIDIVSIEANQKVSLTLDAFPDMSFTGKVLAVDTSGASNSGVTTYTVTILMDPTPVSIYPKMAVSAEIITDVVSDVLLVPASAVTSQGDGFVVQILNDGEPEFTGVDVGNTNGRKTVILSGLEEGAEVVTATIGGASEVSSERNSNVTSPFSSVGGMGGGGGMVRIEGGFSSPR